MSLRYPKEPEEKAKELVGFFDYTICNDCGISSSESSETAARNVAVKCIDEILKEIDAPESDDTFCSRMDVRYWRRVKVEIYNLQPD